MILADQLTELISAGFAGIWVETQEPEEAERSILEVAALKKMLSSSWKVTDEQNLISALSSIKQNSEGNSIYCFHWLNRFTEDPMISQLCYDCIIHGKSIGSFLIVLAPCKSIPIELAKHFVVIDHPLPALNELDKIACDIADLSQIGNAKEAIPAALGLTRYEAEGAFALSLVRHKELKAETIWEIKEGNLKKDGLLTLYRGTESFENIGGMNGLKQFCKKAVGSNKSRGVCLLGVPGTGKSAFAKALGTECSRPTVHFDIGSVFGSLVGETESKIRKSMAQVDSMQPCVLFIDEIEKCLFGSTGQFQGDSGVSSRVLGSLLVWLQDHKTDVFTIVTCNNASLLPPEFLRSERFDATFFIDLPSEESKKAIWSIYRKQYNITDNLLPDCRDWTGAEIKSCCRLASILDIGLLNAADYVVPLCISAREQISSLRNWANGRCLNAETGKVFAIDNAKQATRRKVGCQ